MAAANLSRSLFMCFPSAFSFICLIFYGENRFGHWRNYRQQKLVGQMLHYTAVYTLRYTIFQSEKETDSGKKWGEGIISYKRKQQKPANAKHCGK